MLFCKIEANDTRVCRKLHSLSAHAEDRTEGKGTINGTACLFKSIYFTEPWTTYSR